MMEPFPDIESIPVETIPAVIIQLAARLAAAQRVGALDKAEPSPPDRWLTADEAAKLLNVTPRWLYRRRLPFAKRLSKKCLRFSESGLRKWQANRS